MLFTKSMLAAAIALFSSVDGHMIMRSPVPYGKSSINSSPLEAGGSDFPCKQRTGVYEAEGANNVMPIGAPQTLSFNGSAVHGGGSCQISLTSDKAPSKSSKWQVIHSIIGGCPAKGVEGNLPEDPHGSGANTYTYAIPEGINPGQYTLAWTWFNKVGNREMYMNCAPVTVTGGSKPRDLTSRAASFPDMFVANVPVTDCTTPQSEDVAFPDPGQSVDKFGAKAPVPPTGPKCGAAGSSSGSSGSSPAPPSNTGGVFAQGGASASPSAAASAPVASPVASPASSPSLPAVAPGGGNTSSGSAGSSAPSGSGSTAPAAPAAPVAPVTPGTGSSTGSSCATPGTEVCSPDGTQIGMCDQTSHVIFGPVASGTKCVGGTMVMAGAGKRSVKFGHVRRGHSFTGGKW